MSKFEKLLHRIKNLDNGLRFDELKKFLNHWDMKLIRLVVVAAISRLEKRTYPHHNSQTRTDKGCICSISKRSY